jgi:hypothetical protein
MEVLKNLTTAINCPAVTFSGSSPLISTPLLCVCLLSGGFIGSREEHCEKTIASHDHGGSVVGVGGGGANAQTAPPTENNQHVISNQDLDLLRKDIRSKKKQLIAANLKLTDAEATKFWPIYDRYTAELAKINDKKFALIQDYADHWGTMADEQASSLLRQWLEVDIATTQLRQKYVPTVSQVLNGRKTATFFQLDRRISMMVDLQLASQLPLVQAQE